MARAPGDTTKPVRRKRNPNEKVLKPIRANAGLIAVYRQRLEAAVRQMNASVRRAIEAAWRRDTPELAQDELPARALQSAVDQMRRKWQSSFDELAEKLGAYFAKAAQDRSDSALKAMLQESGITVEFRMTRTMQDVLRASVQANVALIKSIPAQYLSSVEGSVMRAAQSGRDLAALSKDLREHYGVTQRRAAFIALDQMNKASSAMAAARQQELGIKEAIWRHSYAGREPRPSHQANDGKRFDLKTGWFDPHEKKWILPGELPRCRCFMTPVLRGFGAKQ